jgi:hypothetical protein
MHSTLQNTDHKKKKTNVFSGYKMVLEEQKYKINWYYIVFKIY